MSAIKVGIAGCGWISNHAHLFVLSETDASKVVSIYDNNETSLLNTGEKWNISDRYIDYDEFLNSGAEAIVLATPNYTHKDFILKTIRQGKWILCEKPFVLNRKEMLEIIKEAGDDRKLLVPAFVNRFRYDICHFREEIKTIGNIRCIEAKWIRRNGIPRPGTWFTNKSLAGGGVLIDLGPHIIDICLYLIHDTYDLDSINIEVLHSKVEYINTKEVNQSKAGWFGRKEEGQFHMDVESKAESAVRIGEVFINMELCWQSEESDDYTQFTVYGTKGSARLDTLFGFSDCRRYKNAKIVTARDNLTVSTNISNNQNTQISAFQNMHSYFMECIRLKNTGSLNLTDAGRTVNIIDEIYKKAGIAL